MSSKDVPDTPKNTNKVDEDLSELLDSALEDFKKTPDPKDTPAQAAGAEKPAPPSDSAEEAWNEEFIKEAAQQFESQLADILCDGNKDAAQEKIQQTFKQMADAAQQVLSNPTGAQSSDPAAESFASSISQTLRGISEGTDGLNSGSLEQDVMGMLQGAEGASNFLPFMQGMMQSLLSKDVLYPSLKDIIDRYPTWLAENKEKLSPEEIQRYNNQQDLMKEVCGVLESEKETDGADVKAQRFEKVLGLMQKLQDYGQPPSDLVGDVGPPLPDLGNISDPNQCALM